ncbi:hypothetical protein ScPMuIL_010675 [Solemya velum]
MALNSVDIMALADMLKPEEDSDSDEDIQTGGYAKLGPGHIGPTNTQPHSETSEKTVKNMKEIWDEAEVAEGSEFDSVYDPRPQPEYDIIYKQTVTPEDMFLQMGNKNPATASCEDMVVKVELPGTSSMSDVQLDVKPKFLDCRTPAFKLGLHLPHPVDHKSGRAQWDKKTQTLVVTLRLSRDFDFINF